MSSHKEFLPGEHAKTFHYQSTFPLLLAIAPRDGLIERWKRIVENHGDINRRAGICNWTRHQGEFSKKLSGWKGQEDARRTMTYIHQKISGRGRGLWIDGAFLYFVFSFPDVEIKAFEGRLLQKLDEFGWLRFNDGYGHFQRGDLDLKMEKYKRHPEDEMAGRMFPASYSTLEIGVKSLGYTEHEDFKQAPWQVQSSGVRLQDKPGKKVKRIKEFKELSPYFPAQVEIGAGPSCEAGIPALHHLHRQYSINDPQTKRFVMDLKRHDVLDRLVSDPTSFFKQTNYIHKAIFNAKPTRFYNTLKEMHLAGVVVGPIISSNFDGLLAEKGLPEIYTRIFTQERFPSISFDERAKSLIVVGSHADRRKIQRRAREKGLRVIYVDPEGFLAEDGSFFCYPLEGPQDDDLVWNATADKFAMEVAEYFNL